MISINVSINLGSGLFQYHLESKSKRIVLFGPSGSGKTTLLKLLAGFFNPDEGFITINEITYFHKERKINKPLYTRRIGYLPQEYTLFPHMNVRENIMYGISFLKGKGISPVKRCHSLADRIGILDKLDTMPHSLSGGEQQRVALARALFIDPDILLLDEPFNALDSETRLRLRNLVLDITSDMDIITFFVTHDLDEAFIMGDHLSVINQGVIYEHGPIKEMLSKPRFIETARLLGFTNEFTITSHDRKYIETPGGYRFEHCCEDKSGNVAVIRPDQVMILREDTNAHLVRENILEGKVNDIREHIQSTNLKVACDGLYLYVSLPGHAARRLNLCQGKKIRLSLKRESLVICNSFQKEK